MPMSAVRHLRDPELDLPQEFWDGVLKTALDMAADPKFPERLRIEVVRLLISHGFANLILQDERIPQAWKDAVIRFAPRPN